MQILQLKVTIGNLVTSMIEENSVESLLVAKVMWTDIMLIKLQDVPPNILFYFILQYQMP